jgi:hypothetical protein
MVVILLFFCHTCLEFLISSCVIHVTTRLTRPLRPNHIRWKGQNSCGWRKEELCCINCVISFFCRLSRVLICVRVCYGCQEKQATLWSVPHIHFQCWNPLWLSTFTYVSFSCSNLSRFSIISIVLFIILITIMCLLIIFHFPCWWKWRHKLFLRQIANNSCFAILRPTVAASWIRLSTSVVRMEHPDHANWQPTVLAWQIPIACLQCWSTPDDGQWTCQKHVEYFIK